jgi:apolipoprotein N-acyltransferase
MIKTGVAVRGVVFAWARALLGLGLSALSAVLLILAFPPFHFWFLAWFAFLPLIMAR